MRNLVSDLKILRIGSESFNELITWFELIKRIETPASRNVPRILIGNKMDLTRDVVIDISFARVGLHFSCITCSNDQYFVPIARNGQNGTGCGS